MLVHLYLEGVLMCAVIESHSCRIVFHKSIFCRPPVSESPGDVGFKYRFPVPSSGPFESEPLGMGLEHLNF